MTFATKFGGGEFFNVEIKDLQYVTLKWLKDTYGDSLFRLRGLFINTKGNYGENACAITFGAVVNLPEHLTQQVRSILNDCDACNDIRNGLVAFRVREYISNNPKAKGKRCFSVTWVDVDADTATVVVDALMNDTGNDNK